MDTICGVGLPELIILALVGFVVIGPNRSRDVALQAGRFIRTVIRSQWWKEFNDITDAIRELPKTLVRLAEIEEAQTEIRGVIDDIDNVTNEIRRDTRIDFGQSADGEAEQRAEKQAVDPANVITDPWGIANATAGTQFLKDDGGAPEPIEDASGQDIKDEGASNA